MTYDMKGMRAGAVLALGLTCMAGFAGAQEFRLGTIVPPGHLWNVYGEKMGEALSARTEGRMSVTVFPAGQLGDEGQMVQQLQSGALDMAFLTMADVSNRVPEFSALFTPFLVSDVAQAAVVLNSEPAQALLDKLPEAMGVVGIDFGVAGMRQMISAKPVASFESLRGLKMRITPFAPARDFYNVLGIAPTPMPLPDVFDALSNGQVDAADVDLEQVLIFRFDEAAPNLLISNHMMFPMVGVVSGRVWAGLAAEDQAILREEMDKVLGEMIEEYARVETERVAKVTEMVPGLQTVGQDFFPGVVEKWEASWADHLPLINELRAIAAAAPQ